MLSKKDGAKNLNHIPALADSVAATTKSVSPEVTDLSMLAATSSGS
eukprot:CAMPEP_0184437028 /NCGR_PEP_ID=MMETSP0738-20130409/572896_1 /TAXON_ID=385413 /ORGANISM="Thalassiosira miniscula, Strain CCMP1093" /LENGTH=45 /DNA_ID= /DNA_START= /DNA_END= /DNA_ORIENTATION=